MDKTKKYIEFTNTPFYASDIDHITLRNDRKVLGYISDAPSDINISTILNEKTLVEGSDVLYEWKDKLSTYFDVVQYYFYKGFIISAEHFNKKFTIERLEQPLTEYTLYVNTHGLERNLPGTPSSYAFDLTNPLYSVPVVTEGKFSNLMDIFTNLHWFGLIDGKYRIVSEATAKANLLRTIKQYAIFRKVGNDGERISDLCNIYYLLIHTISPNLSDEYQAAVAPITEDIPIPTTARIHNIAMREKLIYKILKDIDERFNSNIRIFL